MSIVDLIIPTLVIFSLIMITWYSGSLVSNYFFKQNNLLALPLGFIPLVAIFQLFSLPFMIVNAKYEYVLIPFFLFFIFAAIYSLKKIIETKMIQNFFSSKFNIFVLAMAILYGIYLFIFSIPYVDSWLFAPLTIISSETGYIYSTDGFTSYTGPVHAFDSYYLFQNCLASISNMDPLLFISTFFKFFEGFIVVFSMAFFAKSFFKDYKLIFFLMLIGVVFWFAPFTNSSQINYAYIPIFLVHMTATGTLLLYMITIPTIILLYQKSKKIHRENIFWLILTIFTFGLSSSALYVVPCGMFAVMVTNYIVDKEIKLKIYIPSLLFCLFEFAIFVASNKISFLIIVAIIIALMYIILERLCNEFFEKFLFFSSIFLYLSFIILFSYIFELNIRENLFIAQIPFIMIIGIIFLYKEDRRLMSFLLITAFIWSNSIIVNIASQTGLASVYHRIEMISSLYLFSILGVVFLIKRFLKFNFLKYGSVAILTILIIYQSLSAVCPNNNVDALNIRKISNYSNFYEFKMYYSSVYYFGNYDYNESSTLQINASIAGNDLAFTGILAMNPTLSKTNNCVENCYVIQEKDEPTPDGFEIVLDNEWFELLYIGNIN